MLYPSNYVNKINNRIIWVTQKNIEVEENRALKKEELKEKIRKSSSLKWIAFTRLNPLAFGFLLSHSFQLICAY